MITVMTTAPGRTAVPNQDRVRSAGARLSFQFSAASQVAANAA
jgi:hypothetical protein